MVEALVVLLGFQLAGEAISYGLGLPIPGPVLGLIAFAIALGISSKLHEMVSDVAHGILRHLSLLFVPAGVGVAAYYDVIESQALPIIAAIIGSTALTLTVTALVFSWLSKTDEAQHDGE